MTTRTKASSKADRLAGSFGFDPDESCAHFVVLIPGANRAAVEISEHFTWDAENIEKSPHYGTDREDGQVRCTLARVKWNLIAEDVRAEFNSRSKREGKRSGRWKTGFNVVNRTFGKELTILAWAIEDADPSIVPHAVANWLGLAPEERWWLYTMTAAATGHYQIGRGRGWRKALRFALTENPVIGRASLEQPVPEFMQFARANERSLFDRLHESVSPMSNIDRTEADIGVTPLESPMATTDETQKKDVAPKTPRKRVRK